MSKLHILIGAWIGVAVVGLGTAAPALVSANNSLAAAAGVGVAGASVFALYKISIAIQDLLKEPK